MYVEVPLVCTSYQMIAEISMMDVSVCFACGFVRIFLERLDIETAAKSLPVFNRRLAVSLHRFGCLRTDVLFM